MVLCLFIFTKYTPDARERRTKVDWAMEIRWPLNEKYPQARKVRLVSDNLNIHVISSLYEAFPASEIDSRKIRKHKNDIVRLVSILSPSVKCQLPKTIHMDMTRFVEGLLHDGVSAEVVDILKTVYTSDD